MIKWLRFKLVWVHWGDLILPGIALFVFLCGLHVLLWLLG